MSQLQDLPYKKLSMWIRGFPRTPTSCSTMLTKRRPVFEIALVRLSETSNYLPGQVNNPSAVIRWTSETLQPSADFPSNAFEVDTNLGHDE